MSPSPLCAAAAALGSLRPPLSSSGRDRVFSFPSSRCRLGPALQHLSSLWQPIAVTPERPTGHCSRRSSLNPSPNCVGSPCSAFPPAASSRWPTRAQSWFNHPAQPVNQILRFPVHSAFRPSSVLTWSVHSVQFSRTERLVVFESSC